MKRRILAVIFSRANYARIRSVLLALKEKPNIELKIVLGASGLIDKTGDIRETLAQDGLPPDRLVYSIVEGGEPVSMVKSTALAMNELSSIFHQMMPDLVLTIADRYETMATAVAASYMNIPLAHTQGGEVSGSIDESVRHAITKLSHYHFPATRRAFDFIKNMGENPKNVFLTGCPALDFLDEAITIDKSKYLVPEIGAGAPNADAKGYIVVSQHPVTTEHLDGCYQAKQTLFAMKKISEEQKLNIFWLWPNIDAGSDSFSKEIRKFREDGNAKNFVFFKNFRPEHYASLIFNSLCVVGNSSSGIRECAYLGIPSVNIGNRQINRERGKNVMDVQTDAKAIEDVVLKQLKHGRYEKSLIFGDGQAGKKIADILSEISLSIDKKLSYLD